MNVAIASRSPTPDIAKTFLDKLGIRSMFVALVSLKEALSPPLFNFWMLRKKY